MVLANRKLKFAEQDRISPAPMELGHLTVIFGQEVCGSNGGLTGIGFNFFRSIVGFAVGGVVCFVGVCAAVARADAGDGGCEACGFQAIAC